MTCATCHQPLCDCTDAAWLGGRSASTIAPPARASEARRTAFDLASIRLHYLHAALGITLIGMAASGKQRIVTHPRADQSRSRMVPA